MKPVCPLCNKRAAERFCPATREKICAICCGTEREVTLDCPSDCSWLVSARRYEQTHPRFAPPESLAFPEIEIPRDFVLEQEEALGGFMAAVRKFADENPQLRDSDALEAIRALAETYRTLQSGIYYERPPDAPLPQALYAALAGFVRESREQQRTRSSAPTLKESQIFPLLVFLLRLGEISSNGRPRSRAFLDYLRRGLPPPQSAGRRASQIILP